MSKKEEIEAKMTGVITTTGMVKTLVDLLQFSKSDTYDDKIEYLKQFKELYKAEPYYQDLKKSVILEVNLLGLLDYDTSVETLSTD